MRRIACSLPLLSAALLVTGCGFNADKAISVAPESKGMHGIIMGGQQPVVGATVTVWAIGQGAPSVALASTTSDASGNFEFNTTPANTYSCGIIADVHSIAPAKTATRALVTKPASRPSKVTATSIHSGSAPAHPAVLPDISQTYVYISAVGGDSGGGFNSSIALTAGLGKCIDARNEVVEINEVSTVVFATVMANFSSDFDDVTSSSDPLQINAVDIADADTFQAFVDLPTGTVKPNVVSTTGGTSVTIDAAKIYSFANTIAACVNSADDTSGTTPVPSDACQTLFSYSGGADTYAAALFIAYQPSLYVKGLYDLAGSKPPFTGLMAAPNDWTLGISYSTPTMGLGLFPTNTGQPTSSNIDIDSSGRVWFPSNKSGAGGIGFFDPTETAFNGPFGGTDSFPLIAPQYVALDDVNQLAWVSDPATADLVAIGTTPGSEGAIAYAYNIHDGFGGQVTNTGTGPLFINSDQSVVVSYDATDLEHLQVLLDGPTGNVPNYNNFTLEPTGLTVNTTLGADPNDPAAPVGIAATSDLSTACNIESSSFTDGNFIIASQPGACATGGAATGEYDFIGNQQDEVTVSSTLNSYCSAVLAKCFPLPEFLQGPQGVAFDGHNEVWFANSGNGSIFTLFGDYSDSDAPTYGLQYSDRAYLHGTDNGTTMTAPVGIAIDRGGNVWTSNANCTSAADTTCVFTLSEVVGIGYSTITPLSSQAARLQGTRPGVVPELASSPVSAHTKKAAARAKTGTSAVR